MVTPAALLVIPVVVVLLLWLFLRADFIPGMLKGLVLAVFGFYVAYISSREHLLFALGGLLLGAGGTYVFFRSFKDEIVADIKEIQNARKRGEE